MISGNLRYTGDLNKPFKSGNLNSVEGLLEVGDPAVHWLNGEGSSSLLYDIAVKSVELLDINYCQIVVLGAEASFHPIAFHRSSTRTSYRNLHPKDALLPQELLQKTILNDQNLVIRCEDTRITLRERIALGAYPQENLLLIPMRLDSEPVGVFVLGFEKFTDVSKKIQLGQLFSKQAAIAVHREGLPIGIQDHSAEIVLALSQALEERDLATAAHCRRITRLAELLAIRCGCTFNEVQTIRRAALLHDIGKIGIPDQILNKPGKLSEKEWVVMRQHPEIGARILKMVRGLADVSRLVLAHHERFDGSGYPYGLSGDMIPLGSRILAVVDAYGAMVMDRIYRPARSYVEAADELQRCSGKDFDPQIVDQFLELLSTMDGLDDER